ncbi:MAG: hypothetical protein ACU836_14845 [Gammaproteobacteria bacterium]
MAESKTHLSSLPSLNLEARPGAVIALRLRTRNRMMAAGLLRPSVDEWVADDGQILPTGARAEPSYLYLLQGAEARQTITLLVPTNVGSGRVLHTWLRFPGLGEDAVAIEVRLLAPAEGKVEAPLECSLEVSLPLGEDPKSVEGGDFGSMAQSSYSLVAGLAGLDMIPARWLAAELLATICQLGAERAKTEDGKSLLNRLGRTRFFKNGVVSFAAAQAPRWILSGLSAASGLHAALGGQVGQGQILYIWERWLLGLAEGDIERDGTNATVRMPHSTLTEFAASGGGAAEHWFANLVLGLAAISPRIAAALDALAAQAPDQPDGPIKPQPPVDDVLGEDGSIGR